MNPPEIACVPPHRPVDRFGPEGNAQIGGKILNLKRLCGKKEKHNILDVSNKTPTS